MCAKLYLLCFEQKFGVQAFHYYHSFFKFQALPQLTDREKLVQIIDPVLEGQFSMKELIQVRLYFGISRETRGLAKESPLLAYSRVDRR
jgi:hypothetical protein